MVGYCGFICMRIRSIEVCCFMNGCWSWLRGMVFMVYWCLRLLLVMVVMVFCMSRVFLNRWGIVLFLLS